MQNGISIYLGLDNTLEENLNFLNDKEQIKDLKNEIYLLMKLRKPLRKKYKKMEKGGVTVNEENRRIKGNYRRWRV